MMNNIFLAGLLDDDLYKFTMGCAVAKLYPRQIVRYRFFNRGCTSFPPGFADRLQLLVNDMSKMRMSEPEYAYLTETCGYFLDPVFIDFLKGYQFNPSEVTIKQVDDKLIIDIEGPWYRTIFWEVCLMALISELYFADQSVQRQRFSSEGHYGLATCLATEKAERLREAGCIFADFGTRRRYSREIHEATISGLIKGGKESFVGTSNIYMAQKFGIKPIGTQAHEWISAHAAMYGYRSANRMSLERWSEVYQGDLGVALTDTFTSKNFWENFGLYHAKLFDGIRHDSADPFKFGEDAISHYESLGINPKTKSIVFSDGLNVDKAIQIQKIFYGRIRLSFGIGTHFTNDMGPKALNMVIKLVEVLVNGKWIPSIKLSDDKGKNTGDKREIELALGILK